MLIMSKTFKNIRIKHFKNQSFLNLKKRRANNLKINVNSLHHRKIMQKGRISKKLNRSKKIRLWSSSISLMTSPKRKSLKEKANKRKKKKKKNQQKRNRR